MKKDKRPAIQFYIGDWRKSEVQLLDFESRGVWFELLLVMYESSSRGRLVFPSGEIMDDDTLANYLGTPIAKWKQIKGKLLRTGVASECDEGGLYNRRMVREAELSATRAEAGRLGGLSKSQPKKGAKNEQLVEDAIAVEEVNKEKDAAPIDEMWSAYVRVTEKKRYSLTVRREAALKRIWKWLAKWKIDRANRVKVFRAMVSAMWLDEWRRGDQNRHDLVTAWKHEEQAEQWFLVSEHVEMRDRVAELKAARMDEGRKEEAEKLTKGDREAAFGLALAEWYAGQPRKEQRGMDDQAAARVAERGLFRHPLTVKMTLHEIIQEWSGLTLDNFDTHEKEGKETDA